ncbi:hypothetical protein O1611_g10160 [Lasiodiplodia mahajangana]|uniref:Uncharacterized protein n=1 Tax=Lasiodiplodia mahajangana TaxID=1108764 RepID=A0ACC2J1M0_9PEZI|nr:hypothetical protein O1611_g10160 [Lasiodiplodia mahajangana]
MSISLSILACRGVRGREAMVSALMKYFQEDQHLDGSMFIQLGQKHNENFGFSLEDGARVEVGQAAVATFETALGAVWALWQVLADPVDVFLVAGKWTEPKKDLIVGRALPIPKSHLDVKIVPKLGQKWRIVYSTKDASGVNIVAEDLLDKGELDNHAGDGY